MRTRIPLLAAAFVTTAVILAVGLLLYYPRFSYARRATSDFEVAHARWQSARPSSYTAIVINNSLTQPTGGANTIRVENGAVVSGQNPQCPSCSPESFSALTIEALFQRIEAECLHDFPTQYCNVAYDQSLGHPVRIDTYPYNHDGQERPSITVESVQIDGS